MARGIPSHPVLAVMLALALLASVSAPVGAAPYTTAGAGDSALITESLAAIDGPGHHFGFGQASVLAQTTPQQTQTAVAAIQTQQAAPPPGSTGSGPCTTVVGQSCTIAGAVSGTWTKTGSGTFTVTATVPATAILNDGAPRIFLPTTAGVETGTCSIPTAIGGTVTCTGTTVGDLLQGATVTVRFVTTGGFQDVTGTVTGPGGVGALSITKTASPTTVTVTDPFTLPTVTYTITLNNTNPAAGAAAQNVSVTDTLPANVTFLSATSTVGTCTGSTGVTTVTCNVGTLAAGQSATITIQVLVPLTVCTGGLGLGTGGLGTGTGTQTLTNTASATATGLVGPPLASATTTVTCPGIGGQGLGLPLLPPPLLLPPPPPPLLPPPPGMGMGQMAAPRAAFPEVPVIPEADSVVLLGIGLAAMAVVAGLRSRRRND